MCFFNQRPFTFAFAKQNISVANYLQFTNEICFQNSKICNSKIGNPAPAWSISWQHWITCQPATLLFPFLPKSRPPQSHIFKSVFLQSDEECPQRCFIKHFPSLIWNLLSKYAIWKFTFISWAWIINVLQASTIGILCPKQMH